MASKARYIFIASMDVDPEKEDLFNEIYDTEHIPLLLKVPGVISAKRYKTEPLDGVRTRRKADRRRRERAALQRRLRNRKPEGSGERRVGQGGGQRALAYRGAALRSQPPPGPAPADRTRFLTRHPTEASANRLFTGKKFSTLYRKPA